MVVGDVGWTLPLEPRLPERAVICSVVRADLPSSAFASPSTTDPDIDSIAAVAANPSNSNPDTARIQAALELLPHGRSVKLAAAGQYDAFLAGALRLPSGVTLWVDTGVTLYASRYPADFTASGLVAGDECGNASATTTGKSCEAFITVAPGAAGSGVVGLGTIDGRGGSALTGGPQAGIMTWWDVALLNKVAGFSQNCPVLLDLTQGGKDFLLFRIALLNSPHFHVKIDSYDGFVAWGVQVLTPSLAYSVPNYACSTLPSNTVAATSPGTCYTPDFAKNTDGIDPGGSRNVLIANSYISDGDDNVAVTASNKSNCITTANGFCLELQHARGAQPFLLWPRDVGGQRDAGRRDRPARLGPVDRWGRQLQWSGSADQDLAGCGRGSLRDVRKGLHPARKATHRHRPFQQRSELHHGLSAESARHPLLRHPRGEPAGCEISGVNQLEQCDERCQRDESADLGVAGQRVFRCGAGLGKLEQGALYRLAQLCQFPHRAGLDELPDTDHGPGRHRDRCGGRHGIQ